MATRIDEIEGIGPVYANKLGAAGVSTVEELLEKGKTPKGRQDLEAATGIDGKRILDWVGMADMFRIKGIGPQFAELLKAAGVDTVKELRNRNAENLHTKLGEVNAEKNLTKAVPRLDQVVDFIHQAKELEPIVTY